MKQKVLHECCCILLSVTRLVGVPSYPRTKQFCRSLFLRKPRIVMLHVDRVLATLPNEAGNAKEIWSSNSSEKVPVRWSTQIFSTTIRRTKCSRHHQEPRHRGLRTLPSTLLASVSQCAHGWKEDAKIIHGHRAYLNRVSLADYQCNSLIIPHFWRWLSISPISYGLQQSKF